MASSVTYAMFAANLPHLATSDEAAQAVIVNYINHAELMIARETFGAAVPSNSTISKADLAVINLAGHYYRHHLRALKTQGEQAVGQVVSVQDNAGSRSYSAIAGNSAANKPADQWLATTPEGLTFIQLRDSIASAALPFVVC